MLMVGLGDLQGLFQPEWFSDSQGCSEGGGGTELGKNLHRYPKSFLYFDVSAAPALVSATRTAHGQQKVQRKNLEPPSCWVSNTAHVNPSSLGTVFWGVYSTREAQHSQHVQAR